MKLKEIIQRVDKSEKNFCYFDLSEIARQEFNISDYISNPDNCRISCYFFFNSYCTDTWVGGRIYFLDDKPIATSWQNYRKSEEKFYWISNSLFQETKHYIISLIEYKAIPDTLADLNTEWGIGHQVQYGAQLLTNDVFYISGKTNAKIVKKFTGHDEIDNWQYVIIDTAEEKGIKVHMKDILIPYNIIEHKT